MNLREQQDRLARLLTASADSIAVREQSGFQGDSNVLAGFAEPAEVRRFKESLLSKRAREAAKLLPLTKEAMDGRFYDEFRRFYGSFNPKASRRHLEDALAFCAHIRMNDKLSRSSRKAAAFEAAKLKFFAHEKRFAIFWSPPDPESTGLRRLPSLALWLRIGGRVRYFSR